MIENYTPENITELKSNEVFAYGSNSAGRHGAGAAKQALKFGAIYGKTGFQGQTYGINTKGFNLEVLSLAEIEKNIIKFFDFARSRPDLTFLLTKIGTGFSGYSCDDIGGLLAKISDIPNNIMIPEEFWKVINQQDPTDYLEYLDEQYYENFL